MHNYGHIVQISDAQKRTFYNFLFKKPPQAPDLGTFGGFGEVFRTFGAWMLLLCRLWEYRYEEKPGTASRSWLFTINL